jgi:hypothetical protein
VSQPTVRKWLIEYAIPRKDQKQSSRLVNSRRGPYKPEVHSQLTKAALTHMFVELRMGAIPIAQQFGVSRSLVRPLLLKYNLYDEREKSIEAELNKAVDLYNEGHKIPDLKRSINAPWDRIHAKIKANCDVRNRNSYERKFNRVSKREVELRDYLQSILPFQEMVFNSRSIGVDLDIYIPQLSIAFEFNGIYWHQEQFKGKTIHYDKFNICRQAGVKLFQIWEDDWITKPNIIKSMIAAKVSVLKETYYARNLLVDFDISSTERSSFLNHNHIQGSVGSSVSIGLRKPDGLLLCLMTFCKTRYDRTHQWELARFAVRQDVSVVGGFSRLLASFKRAYDPRSIVSYSDNGYSDGGVYRVNGFEIIRESKSTYWYIVDDQRVSRMNFQKKNIIRRYPHIDPNLTERGMMEVLNIPRIWTAGTTTWSWAA